MADEQAPEFQAIAGRDVFISYASQDAAVANAIVEALEKRRIRCWIAPRDVVPGESFAGAIVHAIDATKVIVLVLSEHAADSQHVLREVERAASKRHAIIAFRLDMKPLPADYEYFLNTSQWLDASTTGVRRALPRLVEAVRGAAAQAPAVPDATSAPTACDVPPTAASTRPSRGRMMVIWSIAALVFALAAAEAFWYSHQRPAGTPKGTTTAGQSPTAPALSIIVLPFANQTGDPQKAYIADALTTSIISDLGRIRDAYVVPAPTAFTYKERQLTIQQVVGDAHVRFVLSGSVESAGTRIRINAQLIDSSGVQIWHRMFSGESTDLFALQDRVTTLVGNSLGREMVIAAARGIQKQSADAQSADLLLRARALSTKPVSLANLQQIEGLYRDLLKRDPGNAIVLSELARVLMVAATNGLYAPKTRAIQNSLLVEADTLAKRARELDADLPEINGVLGATATYRGDLVTAEREWRAGVEKAPKYPNNYNNLGILFYMRNEPKKALELFNPAAALLPDSPSDIILLNISIANLELADYAAAADSIEKTLEISPHLDPAFSVAAVAHELKGDHAAARRWADKSKTTGLVPTDVLGFPIESGSQTFQHWANAVFLPTWRKLGLPE